MRTIHRGVLALALPVLSVSLLGCGSEAATTAAESPTPADLPELTGLTCPSGEFVGTAGGLLTEFPQGADTPEEVVEAKSTPEEPWVLVGNKAYVLRPDGTAYEVHDLVKGPKGWFLHGYEACADGR